MTERLYTVEQERVIVRVLRENDFYKILQVEREHNEVQLKKSYRKVRVG